MYKHVVILGALALSACGGGGGGGGGTIDSFDGTIRELARLDAAFDEGAGLVAVNTSAVPNTATFNGVVVFAENYDVPASRIENGDVYYSTVGVSVNFGSDTINGRARNFYYQDYGASSNGSAVSGDISVNVAPGSTINDPFPSGAANSTPLAVTGTLDGMAVTDGTGTTGLFVGPSQSSLEFFAATGNVEFDTTTDLYMLLLADR